MIKLKIKNLKNIKDFEIDLPYDKKLFAISGENGIGKSTILSVLAKLVYDGALRNYFRNSGDNNSEITFEYEGKINTWIKRINWQRNNPENEIIKFYGTYEASILFGSRYTDLHKSKIKNLSKITNNDLIDAPIFIKDKLQEIIGKTKTYYENLKMIQSLTKAKSLGFDSQIYFFENNGKLIPEFFMSTGEILILGLLNFINKAKNLQSEKTKMIIIDEIDTALHPAAQIRLVKFLNMISNEYNFCIYFSTHSIPILNFLKPEKIYHLQKNINDNIEVINPCYAAYATRDLYNTNMGFDFLILVEDELCKFIIDKILDCHNLYNKKLIKILPCGGWVNTISFHKEIKTANLMANSCQIITILDGDIKEDFGNKYGTSMDSFRKSFLPIKSIEKYLKLKLIDALDTNFFSSFSDKFYKQKRLIDIINDYKNNTSNDNNGKKLFMVLKACAVEEGALEEIWKNHVCEFIYEHDNFTELDNTIKQFIDG